MSERKVGRQSAESAELSRNKIICAAAELFARKGFEAVSVREIAEAAEVSHGLIRHHFGSKLQIWQRICELIVDNVHQETEHVLQRLDPQLAPNQRLFTLLSTLLASQLNDPRMMKLMADAFRTDQHKFEIFKNMPKRIEVLMQAELKQVQNQGYLSGLVVAEMKWLLCIFADAPAMLEPLMKDTYGEDIEQARLSHWRLGCRMLAGLLGIDFNQLPEVNHLDEIATEIECALGCDAIT